MDYEKAKKLFQDLKANTNLDYVYLDAAELGDCGTCVNDELISLYGEHSHGIFAKYWTSGMNAFDLADCDELYISHDVTTKQFEQIKTICQQHGYNFLPDNCDPIEAIMLTEKKH